MPLKNKEDYIPIKCEGWNGKFVYPPGSTNNVSKVRRYNQNVTDTKNFYGHCKEPIILPPVWDGTFKKSDEVRVKQERNCSNDAEYFQYSNEPTVLPVAWNGEFRQDPNDVRTIPERNVSDPRDYAEANSFKSVNK